MGFWAYAGLLNLKNIVEANVGLKTIAATKSGAFLPASRPT
jgi:hypothetical protein